MIISLYGADSFRAHRFLQEMRDKFIRDVDQEADSLGFIDGRNATVAEISDRATTGSLFVKKRFLAIDGVFQNKKAGTLAGLLDYLQKLPAADENILIFRDGELNTKDKPLKGEAKKLFDFLSRQKYSQEFKALSGPQLLAFIKKEAALYGKEVGVNAAGRLIALSGGDTWTLANEIKKLSFFVSEKQIGDQAVLDICSGQASEDIFALTDALGAKNQKAAIRLLEEQYAAGLSDEYLISMLVRQTRIMIQMQAALSGRKTPAETAAALKLHPFVVKKGLAQARNFSSETLKNLLNGLLRLDYENKTGGAQMKAELLLLLSHI